MEESRSELEVYCSVKQNKLCVFTVHWHESDTFKNSADFCAGFGCSIERNAKANQHLRPYLRKSYSYVTC